MKHLDRAAKLQELLKDLFPDDPQSQLNPFEYVKTLNFVPVVEHLEV